MNENLDPTGLNFNSEEQEFDRALRPLTFDDFAGQEAILENLKIFVAASMKDRTLWIIHFFMALLV